MPYGIKIGSHAYNVFCYADDILLLSVTPKGVQKLIDAANCFITGHGLGFSHSQSICVVFGISKLSCLRWYVKGLALPICDSVKYLGKNRESPLYFTFVVKAIAISAIES